MRPSVTQGVILGFRPARHVGPIGEAHRPQTDVVFRQPNGIGTEKRVCGRKGTLSFYRGVLSTGVGGSD